jgi:hypothetical protein
MLDKTGFWLNIPKLRMIWIFHYQYTFLDIFSKKNNLASAQRWRYSKWKLEIIMKLNRRLLFFLYSVIFYLNMWAHYEWAEVCKWYPFAMVLHSLLISPLTCRYLNIFKWTFSLILQADVKMEKEIGTRKSHLCY